MGTDVNDLISNYEQVELQLNGVEVPSTSEQTGLGKHTMQQDGLHRKELIGDDVMPRAPDEAAARSLDRPLRECMNNLWLVAVMGGFLAIICVSNTRFMIPQPGIDW